MTTTRKLNGKEIGFRLFQLNVISREIPLVFLASDPLESVELAPVKGNSDMNFRWVG